MGISELQQCLLKQYLQNPENEAHAISIQDVVLVYLKQTLGSEPASYTDPTKLTKVVDDSIELNNQINQMLSFVNQVAGSLINE